MHKCKDMNFFVKSKKDPINYNPVFREYFIELKGQNNIITFAYCPWCSKELASLRDMFFKVIFEELGLSGEEDPKLPEEFRTDEWWKKRGL